MEVTDLISPQNAIKNYLGPQSSSWLDVRSEKEFSIGAIPGSINVPILNDEHRHLVGKTYKNEGADKAQDLGHQLVDPLKLELLAKWENILKGSDPKILFCWRGGLRSQIAQAWLKTYGLETVRISGGYKALRGHLLSVLESLPPMVVVSGRTGSHKTVWLKEMESQKYIDLEGLAQHRGSAFGRSLGTAQPTQANFENQLFMELLQKSHEVFLEDESRLIGYRSLPKSLFQKMAQAPRIFIDCPLEQRVLHIITDYIVDPLKKDSSASEPLRSYFLESLFRIKKRLGGALFQELTSLVDHAFTKNAHQVSHHLQWVTLLLERYYDKSYDHSFSRLEPQIVFRGSYEDCRDWQIRRK